MTPEQQRIKIAEACGWEMASGTMRGQPVGIHPDEIDSATCFDYRMIPDYLNALNAMHEAEKTLSENDQQKYLDILADAPRNDRYLTWADSVFATAAQRAEAFLRATGMWDYSEAEIDPRGFEERSMM